MPKGLATALGLEIVVLGVLAAIALDMYAHKRVESLGGVNIWGYRGPVLRQRAPNEIRIAVVGGDLAFGWGVGASETLASNIRRLVALETDRPGHLLRPVVAVNLGAMGLPPQRYAAWIERFGYLRPDVVCLVLDPRRHVPPSSAVPDRESVVFAAFGYAPILPLVLKEKGSVTGWPALRLAGSVLSTVDRTLWSLGRGNSVGAAHDDLDAVPLDGMRYVTAIAAAARQALDQGARVVVVAPAYTDGDEVADHEQTRAAVAAVGGTTGRVRFVDLGDSPEMYQDGLLLDGFNYGGGGEAIAAQLIAPAVLDLLQGRP